MALEMTNNRRRASVAYGEVALGYAHAHYAHDRAQSGHSNHHHLHLVEEEGDQSIWGHDAEGSGGTGLAADTSSSLSSFVAHHDQHHQHQHHHNQHYYQGHVYHSLSPPSHQQHHFEPAPTFSSPFSSTQPISDVHSHTSSRSSPSLASNYISPHPSSSLSLSPVGEYGLTQMSTGSHASVLFGSFIGDQTSDPTNYTISPLGTYSALPTVPPHSIFPPPPPELPALGVELEANQEPQPTLTRTRKDSVSSTVESPKVTGTPKGSAVKKERANSSGVKRTPKGTPRSKAKIFHCTDYGECGSTFTRAEHLARHIRLVFCRLLSLLSVVFDSS